MKGKYYTWNELQHLPEKHFKRVMRNRTYKLLKRELESGNRRCFICGKKDKLEFHHFIYHDALAVILVCKKCHALFPKERKCLKCGKVKPSFEFRYGQICLECFKHKP